MGTVEIIERSLVAPSEETPKERQWLSNFDLSVLPSIYTSLIYLYKFNGDPDFFSVTNIKAALAKALVLFYPFAGRLSEDKEGRLEIDCNAEGALFVAARSTRTFDQVTNYVPSAENRKLFVPVVDSDTPPPLLLLQVNNLKNHPGRVSTSGTGTVSTFHAVSAHIWKCLCLARRLSPDKESHLLFPVQIRSRISPPLPKYFFGNTGTCGLASAKVSEVIKFIPERIRESVVRIDDAYVRESIDYLEVADKESSSKRFGMTAYDMCVTSWLGAPCYDADFGYGNPVFVTRAESGIGGIAVLMNNPGKDQGISVLIGLEPEIMEQFKTIFYDLNYHLLNIYQ